MSGRVFPSEGFAEVRPVQKLATSTTLYIQLHAFLISEATLSEGRFVAIRETVHYNAPTYGEEIL